MVAFLVLSGVGGLIYYWVISWGVKASGRALAAKIDSIGTLKGRTKDEIINIAGQPNGVSAMSDGSQLLQWMATGYHIALVFDPHGICQGVSSEFSQVTSPTSQTISSSKPSYDYSQVMSSIIQNLPKNLQDKFCPNCGVSRSPSTKFCGKCGAKFPEEA